MTSKPIAARFSSWAIVAGPAAYEARELAYDQLGSPNVVAIHPDEDSARKGLERVMALQAAMQKQWQASIDHELALRGKMVAALHEIAKPRSGEA